MSTTLVQVTNIFCLITTLVSFWHLCHHILSAVVRMIPQNPLTSFHHIWNTRPHHGLQESIWSRLWLLLHPHPISSPLPFTLYQSHWPFLKHADSAWNALSVNIHGRLLCLIQLSVPVSTIARGSHQRHPTSQPKGTQNKKLSQGNVSLNNQLIASLI